MTNYILKTNCTIRVDRWADMDIKYGVYKACIDAPQLFIPYMEWFIPEDRKVEAEEIKEGYIVKLDGMAFLIDKTLARKI